MFDDYTQIPPSERLMTLARIGHAQINKTVEVQPYVSLVIGKDMWSWGAAVLLGREGLGPRGQRCEMAVNSRWRRDLLDLPEAVLLAQSVLRKVSLDRGWPIP